MMAVWKAGEANVKSFLENMEKPRVPYTTLASTIKNLEKKGYLKSRMIGNTYLYRAAITQDSVAAGHFLASGWIQPSEVGGRTLRGRRELGSWMIGSPPSRG